MAKYTMVFHAYLGDEGPNEGPLGQENEYEQYSVVPRVGEEVITGFDSLDTNSRWLVRAVRHSVQKGQADEIVDLIPAHD
jgi:hypothetical protein